MTTPVELNLNLSLEQKLELAAQIMADVQHNLDWCKARLAELERKPVFTTPLPVHPALLKEVTG